MFKKHRDRKSAGRETAPERESENGFAELEGDFEAERRRAASGAHQRTQPYEHGDTNRPVLPGSTAGLTHP